MGFSHGTVAQNLPENAGDIRDEGSITGSGRTPAGGNDNSLQYFCREDSIPRPTAPGVTKSRTELSTHIHAEGAYGDGRFCTFIVVVVTQSCLYDKFP